MALKRYAVPRCTLAGDATAKKPKEKERPPEISNADWAADVTRRNIESASRRERERRAKERNADLTRQMEAQRVAASAHMAAQRGGAAASAQMAGIPVPRPPSGQHWSSCSQVSSSSSSPSPAGISLVSPHMPHYHQGNATPSLSLFSPDYPDTDPLGGFNPNTFATDPLGGFNPNFASPPLWRGPLSYGGSSPSASFQQFPAGCSQPVPNLFGGMSQGDSIMADMINHSSQHAHYTYTQEEEPYAAEDIEEREEWADGTEEPKKGGGGGRGPKWTAKEDECLAEAWKVVSLDPFTGANQSGDTYWRRVKTAYDECRVIIREFASVTHDRNESGLSHRRANDPTSVQQVAWHSRRGAPATRKRHQRP
ncbi:hypothetical protein BRADI_1g06376v3 [Brachypodium distachyon]|uniref:Uncharacterized protein n=1 Tax=Brachypodium distachyon TaxID=15368 RepID=A0A2K2DI96_BRADI|nr:hypothetical protein BRADI_1g06376v3 [Brachypodium distachyon]